MSIDDAARYLYIIAIIIRKDFNTGSYVLKHEQRARMIEKYFNCTTEVHKNLQGEALRDVLIAELDEDRPILIHLRNRMKWSFHAALLDGYKATHNSYVFHFNIGHKGYDDGWFRLDQPIGKYND